MKEKAKKTVAKEDNMKANKKEKMISEESNIKIPQEVSQKMLKKVFIELLKAIGIMVYFIVLVFAYNKMKQNRLVGDIKVFAGVFLFIGILLLEKAYKNDKEITALSAIESIILSIHALTIINVITLQKYDLKTYLIISSFVFAIYYVLKSVIIYTKEKKEYVDSLSDISDIVKKEEPIKKEAKKRKKVEQKVEQKKEVTVINKKTTKKSKNKKEVK